MSTYSSSRISFAGKDNTCRLVGIAGSVPITSLVLVEEDATSGGRVKMGVSPEVDGVENAGKCAVIEGGGSIPMPRRDGGGGKGNLNCV